MLGKLLKHEFRATARFFLPIYLAMALLAGLMCLLRALPEGSNGVSFFIFIAGLIYVLCAFGLAVTTVVVLISRFYKNLLGAEGYLMFTLPVTAGQNILAKLIPALCWSVGSFCLCFLVIFLQNLMNGEVTLRLTSGDTLGILLLLLLCLAAFILFCYMCMGIGQLFNEHKLLASIGAFIVIQLLLQILGFSTVFALLRWHMAADLALDFHQLYELPSWLPLAGLNAAAAVVCLVLFLITRWLLDKKLNLA